MFLWNHNVRIVSLKSKQLNVQHILKIIKIVLDITIIFLLIYIQLNFNIIVIFLSKLIYFIDLYFKNMCRVLRQ